jgi:ABC-type multidrug transport system ATPase subunit
MPAITRTGVQRSTIRKRIHDLERTRDTDACRNLTGTGYRAAVRERPMLTIRNLSKTYANGVRALRDVSLDIPNGMFGLLGPNGAGKSSLMRTIGTLQDPDAGSITLDGTDLLADKQATRRLLGYLPQEFGVYPKVSAEAMLNHFAVLKGVTVKSERRELVEALLRQVNLWDGRQRKLGTYSGGMRQRFGIAQALIGDPRLVIVDEPTAGLDPEERNRFLNLLAEIGERVVVILSTHIVEDVTDLCSRMAIIGQGQVLLAGEPTEALRALDGRVWRRSIDKAELDGYRARMNILSTRLAAGRTLLHVLADTQPEAGFEAVAPDLEDVYFGQLRAQAMTKAA